MTKQALDVTRKGMAFGAAVAAFVAMVTLAILKRTMKGGFKVIW